MKLARPASRWRPSQVILSVMRHVWRADDRKRRAMRGFRREDVSRAVAGLSLAGSLWGCSGPSEVPQLAGSYRLGMSTANCPGFFPLTEIERTATIAQQDRFFSVEIGTTSTAVDVSSDIAGNVFRQTVVIERWVLRESAADGSFSLTVTGTGTDRTGEGRVVGSRITGTIQGTVMYVTAFPEAFIFQAELPFALTRQ